MILRKSGHIPKIEGHGPVFPAMETPGCGSVLPLSGLFFVEERWAYLFHVLWADEFWDCPMTASQKYQTCWEADDVSVGLCLQGT